MFADANDGVIASGSDQVMISGKDDEKLVKLPVKQGQGEEEESFLTM